MEKSCRIQPDLEYELWTFWFRWLVLQKESQATRFPCHSVRRQLIMAGFPASDLPREETSRTQNQGRGNFPFPVTPAAGLTDPEGATGEVNEVVQFF